MVSPINRSSFAKALYPGVSKWYGTSYNEFNVEYTDLYDEYSSSRAYEEDVGITSFGLAQKKTEGGAITYDSERQAFTTRYAHVVYALGFQITEEMFEDDLYDLVGQRRSKGLAFSMRQTKEVVGADLYNNAFAAGSTGGDGVSMCNDAHPNFSGGTWDNKTTADLSEAALEDACIAIGKWTDDRGKRIQVMPHCLIVPIDQQFNAERILGSQYRTAASVQADAGISGGGNDVNDINALVHMGKMPGGYKVNHYLTSTDSWFIRNKGIVDGLKCFNRRANRFAVDNDFDTANAKYKSSERYSFGYTDPRAIYGSDGTA